ETQRKFRDATTEARKHGVDIGKAAKQYKQLDTAMAQAERRMTRMQKMQANRDTRQEIHGQFMGVAAAGASVAFPIKQAMDFESVMADVKKVTEFESPRQFEQMKKDVLDLSKSMPMAASGIGDIVAAAGQAGIAQDQMTEFAETAVKMGTAFDMTGRESGKILSSWRAGMKLSQDEAESLADAVNHLSNNMNAQAGDLSKVIQRQGAAAKAAGLHETQVASLGAALLSAGTGPERSATALKKLTNSLTMGEKATARQRDALQELGFSSEELAERMQTDAQGAIMDVFAAMQKLPKAAQPGIIKELFGEESQGAIAPLLGNLENLQQAFDLTAKKAEYVGSMQAEYEERSKTTANELQLLKNQTTALGVTLGSVLLPPLRTVMGVIGKGAGTLADFADEHPLLTKVVIGSAAALVGFKIASLAGRYGMTLLSDAVQFGKGVFDFFRPSVLATNAAMARQKAAAVGLAAKQWIVVGAIKAATAAQWLWNVAFKASPIGRILIGVLGLATAAFALVKYWKPVKSFFSGLWPGIKDGVLMLKIGLQEVFSWLKPVGTLFQWLGRTIKTVTSAVGGFLSSFDNSADSLRTAKSAGYGFGTMLGMVGTGLASYVAIKKTVIAVTKTFAALQKIAAFRTKVWTAAQWALSKAYGAAAFIGAKTKIIGITVAQKTAAAGARTWAAGQVLVNKAFGAVAFLGAKAKVLGLAAAQKMVAAGAKAWTAAQWALNVALNANPIGLVIAGVAALAASAYFLVKKWDTVKSFFTGLWDWLSNFNLFEIGKNIIGTLVSGMKSLAMKPVNAVKGIFGKVREFLPFSDARRGPLSDLTASGKAIPKTIGEGIRKSSPEIDRAAKKALEGVSRPRRSFLAGRGPDQERVREGGRGGEPEPLSRSGGAPSVTISQTFYINGDQAAAETGVREAGRDAAAEARRAIEDFFRKEQRLSYA
ncbi:MAG: phage tail tape measure protein, partial [Desulfosudaceae bacterium]